MNSIWSSLYDRLKDRRYGLLFFVTFFIFLILLLMLLMALPIKRGGNGLELQITIPEILSASAVFLPLLIWRIMRWKRSRQRSSWPEFPPLSRDEREKARSKLIRNRT